MAEEENKIAKINPPSSRNGNRLPRGRPKGALNKVNVLKQAVSDQLLEAWQNADGPAAAKKIIKAAASAAEEGDFAPLSAILPYIARKQPERLEASLVEAMSPEEIETLWPKRQDL